MEDERPICIGCLRSFEWDEDWRLDDNGEVGCIACFEDDAVCPFSAQGTSAGTAETGTGSGLQPAGPVAESDAP